MKIQTKLLLTFVLAGISLMLVATKLMQFSFDKGMVDYLNLRQVQEYEPLASSFSDYYKLNGDWEKIRSNPRDFHEIMRTFHEQDINSIFFGPLSRPEKRNGKRRPPPHEQGFSPRDSQQGAGRKKGAKKKGNRYKKGVSISLLDSNKDKLFGPYKQSAPASLINIEVDDDVVGYLVIPKIIVADDALDLRFIKQQRQQFLWIAILVTASAIVLALLLAQHFVRPIKHLAKLTDAVANGDYSTKSTLNRKDELGELSIRLHSMTQQLKLAEESRRRWVADFSHELRTPLAILRGEIEAILDGVRKADQNNIRSLHEEVQHLQKLIDDLYQLSNADAGEMQYKKEDINLKDIIESVLEHHQERFKQKNIRMVSDVHQQGDFTIWADETRLQQLFDNVLNNSYKYTDDNGDISISLRKDTSDYIIRINDSAPGVSDADLPKLFDYLYRTEASRNRKTGGSGLGLAICARIVEAHNGTITTEHSSLGGLAITIRLPIR